MLGSFVSMFVLVNLILTYNSLDHGIGKGIGGHFNDDVSNVCAIIGHAISNCQAIPHFMCHYWSCYLKLSGHTTFQIMYAYK